MKHTYAEAGACFFACRGMSLFLLTMNPQIVQGSMFLSFVLCFRGRGAGKGAFPFPFPFPFPLSLLSLPLGAFPLPLSDRLAGIIWNRVQDGDQARSTITEEGREGRKKEVKRVTAGIGGRKT